MQVIASIYSHYLNNSNYSNYSNLPTIYSKSFFLIFDHAHLQDLRQHVGLCSQSGFSLWLFCGFDFWSARFILLRNFSRAHPLQVSGNMFLLNFFHLSMCFKDFCES